MAHLLARLCRVEADRAAGVVHMVRGGRSRANGRHHLSGDGGALMAWRTEWEASRLFLQADGEAGKPGGNDTIRIDGEGRVSIRLPKALEHYANAPYGRYVLDAPVRFAWRSGEWAERQAAGAALAYRIAFDPTRDGRWYLTCSWTAAQTAAPSSRSPQPNGDKAALKPALAHGAAGIDLNADHLAVWRLDEHGNPVGRPKDFPFDLSGVGSHRDAQIRQTITRLLQWCGKHDVRALVIEDLDFTDSKSRDRHGRRKFRNLISAFPTAIFKRRLRGMATRAGMVLVAVDPAYSSIWGNQHWRTPTSTSGHETTRHQAASLVIGRRAFGYSARRRRPVPAPVGARAEAAHCHRSDGSGHRDRAASRCPVERGTPAPVPDPGGSGRPGPSPGPGTAHAMRRPQREDPRSRNGGTSLSPTVRDRPLTSTQGNQSPLATQRSRTV
ncbi:IS200/IS605 family accessory protein TnpB-related protein [Streptomyces sp. NPDC054871]